MSDIRISPEMKDAGLEALRASVAAEVLEQQGADPAQMVTAIYAEMAKRQWLPIGTAPRSPTNNVMLGYFGPQGFTVGIGRYVPADDDVGTGQWSTQGWWGAAPTHWMPIPPGPQQADV